MLAPDGKQRLTGCASTKTLLRVIQSISSPKVKQWRQVLNDDFAPRVGLNSRLAPNVPQSASGQDAHAPATQTHSQ
ncbi:MAG: hypothetical protein D4R70_02230 [Betaproteobacteria bacterium]|nr:MAG: hypothetical protein D4R70_02230 [Betaproteobacteria bacterium]